MIETPEEFANAVIFEWRNDRQDPPRFLRQVIAENTTARDAAIRTECAENWERRYWDFPDGHIPTDGISDKNKKEIAEYRAAIMAEPKADA